MVYYAQFVHMYLNFLMSIFFFPVTASAVRIISLESEVVITDGDTQQADAALQIQSTTPDEMPNILVWQLGLEIVPSDTATGNVGFKEMHIPDNYLFPGMSFPMSIPNLPQSTPPSSITISDFYVPGVALVDNTPRNLITLDFRSSENASGIFHLVLSPFSNSTLNSSMWASELILDPADAQEFENADRRVLPSRDWREGGDDHSYRLVVRLCGAQLDRVLLDPWCA